MRTLIILALLAGALLQGWKYLSGYQEGNPSGQTRQASGNVDLQALAKTVPAGAVMMYTTSECPYCAQARSWLDQYGFSYTECNMSHDQSCHSEMQRLGGQGVPFLVVRGEPMGDGGFDTEEFIRRLRQ